MRKTLLVGWREFRQRVRKRAFLLTSIGTPLVLIIVWAFTGTISAPAQQPLQGLAQSEQSSNVIGYIDQAGLIQSIPEPIPSARFRAFPDTAAAEAALRQGEIAAYYVVSPDYRQTGDVQRVSLRLSTSPADTQWFEWVLVRNLFPDATVQQVTRWNWPFNGTSPKFVSVSSGGQTRTGNSILPFIVTIAIMIPLFTSGSLLFQSLAQEKSSRVMEVLLVSLRPRQLLTGKLLGLGALTLVQYAIWAAITGVGELVIGGSATRFVSGIQLTPDELALVVPFALGGFVLYAALMAGIGALSPDIESSRIWILILTLPMLIPIYVWTAITGAPNGTLATVLSLIPFSAPVAMLMRMTSTAVPSSQLFTSLALLLLTGAGMVWLMARLFRAQTLLSGEAFSIRRVWSALTS